MSNPENPESEEARGTKPLAPRESRRNGNETPKDATARSDYRLSVIATLIALLSAVFSGGALYQADQQRRSQLRTDLREILLDLEDLRDYEVREVRKLKGMEQQVAGVAVNNKRVSLVASAELVVSDIGEELRPEHFGVLAAAHQDIGNLDRAIFYYRRVLKDSDVPAVRGGVLRSLGEIYFSQAEVVKARAAFQNALDELDPTDSGTLNHRCFVRQRWLARETVGAIRDTILADHVEECSEHGAGPSLPADDTRAEGRGY